MRQFFVDAGAAENGARLVLVRLGADRGKALADACDLLFKLALRGADGSGERRHRAARGDARGEERILRRQRGGFVLFGVLVCVLFVRFGLCGVEGFRLGLFDGGLRVVRRGCFDFLCVRFGAFRRFFFDFFFKRGFVRGFRPFDGLFDRDIPGAFFQNRLFGNFRVFARLDGVPSVRFFRNFIAVRFEGLVIVLRFVRLFVRFGCIERGGRRVERIERGGNDGRVLFEDGLFGGFVELVVEIVAERFVGGVFKIIVIRFVGSIGGVEIAENIGRGIEIGL